MSTYHIAYETVKSIKTKSRPTLMLNENGSELVCFKDGVLRSIPISVREKEFVERLMGSFKSVQKLKVLLKDLSVLYDDPEYEIFVLKYLGVKKPEVKRKYSFRNFEQYLKGKI